MLYSLISSPLLSMKSVRELTVSFSLLSSLSLGTTLPKAIILVSTAAIKPNNTVRLPHSLLGKSLHFTKFCKLNVAVVVR
ncbi:hypothetical protein Bca4012_092791 [Brassica carinata]